MALPQSELQALLKGLDGVQDAYIQAPSKGLQYPCIMIESDRSQKTFADNGNYFIKRGYTITVIDRDPKSKIPDLVENLRYTSFQRFFRREGLNHTVFQMYY